MDFVRQFDVAMNMDFAPVGRHGGKIFLLDQRLLEGLELFLQLAIACQCAFIRPQDDDAAVAVDDDRLTTGDISRDRFKSHHGRHLKSPG